MKESWRNEDGLTLVEVVVTMSVIILVLTFTAAGFMQVQKAQDVSSLRSQGHSFVSQALSQYREYPFDRIGLSSDLKNTPVDNDGLYGVNEHEGEPIVFDERYTQSIIPHKQAEVIGAGQYEVTTYVTDPTGTVNTSNTDYQPVRVWVEIDLGETAGTISDSALVYPSYQECPQKKALDPNVSTLQGCA